jgi:hypothetical protein
MNKRSFIFILFALIAAVGFAQAGGVKGKVVSRDTRAAIDGTRVTLTPGDATTTTDDNGYFLFDGLNSGEYTLTFEAADYETMSLPVRVDRMIRDINLVIMVPDVAGQTPDDAIFAELDNETLEDAQSIPSSLSASKDLFNNIASYKFSEMRFNVRGYDSQYSDVYMNGIRMNDAMTGYTPWSLWSGLNDATRNQEVTSGLIASDAGVGGMGGTTNIITSPSQMRKGFRASLVNGNSMYRFRGMLTYASGAQDNGWAYAFSVSTRQGGNEYVNGVYYNAYGYFGTVEKTFNDQHRLALMVLGAPTERGVQQASTQEVYDLVGNNYYNPNWGWQDGKRRNSRVRNFHEPIIMANYTFNISDRDKLNMATSFRFGKNGYSSLTWYAGQDPRPDYYRYLPSYYNGTTQGAWLQEAWTSNSNNIRHIDWDQLYYVNRTQQGSSVYGNGTRSINIIEERHTDQRDWNFATNYSHLFRDNSTIKAGVNVRRNRTNYYTKVKDLLGGDYWIDIDKFAERDMGTTDPILYQNNMAYYNKYGHAQGATKGDKISYNYYGNVVRYNGWLQYDFNLSPVNVNLAGEIGHAIIWRNGLWQKGLFMDNSYGNSAKQNYLEYKTKANFAYRVNANNSFEANIAYIQSAPSFQYAFVSPRTRNSATPGVSAEKNFSVDASYNLRLGDARFRLTGYYTKTMDQTKVISYYDDVESTYSNFAMSGIDKKYFGMEFATNIPLIAGISFNGAVSWGQYTYDNNPNYVQIQDNSGEIQNQGKVYWKNFRVESTPQTAINMGLSYKSKNNIYISVDANYYNNMYISMSPLYRTDEVLSMHMSQADIDALRQQENFGAAWVMNASIGKNWSIQRKYTLGISVEAKNLLNNQDIKTGGYEQVRLLKNTDSNYTTYQPFESKYFYMFGTTYYANLYFRF